MKTTKLAMLSMMVLLLSMTACKKNHTSKAGATFSVKAKNLSALRMANTGTFNFTKAMLGLSKIKFKKEVGDNEMKYKFEGIYSFDILTGTCQPPLGVIEIDPGKYTKLKIKVDNVMPTGNSIEIEGTYTENGTDYPFEFTSTLDEDYEIENPTGITVDANQEIHFVLYLDLKSLFNGVNFSTATVGNDGVIHINHNSNSQLASIIENNFDDAMDFDDDNDD